MRAHVVFQLLYNDRYQGDQSHILIDKKILICLAKESVAFVFDINDYELETCHVIVDGATARNINREQMI